ncbi:MAG: cyd operon protein YbgT [Bosea sp. 12-68-7]|nr:MAG: cyd operon protein YbgT [Bosea sp. 12-68-7]
MWYFAWILGVTAALAIAVINVMWFEFQNEFETRDTALPGVDEARDGARAVAAAMPERVAQSISAQT